MEKYTQNSALLVMDMQAAMLPSLSNHQELISNNAKAIAAARANNIPVIYVVVGFRKGLPEISMNNKTFAAAKERFANVPMEEFMKIEPALAPQEGEVTVTKRRFSAFAGSDLAVVLSAYETRHLILTGIVTSGVVLSTLREAADKDFRLTVLADCCGDHDPEVHQMLVDKIFPRQAEVLTVDQWINA
jgi:nicotinamidase-related amidase